MNNTSRVVIPRTDELADPEVSGYTIGGIPAELWIGRAVRSRGHSRSGDHAILATLKNIHRNGMATVRPPGHGQDEVVSVADLLPSWSKSPDLKEKADELKRVNLTVVGKEPAAEGRYVKTRSQVDGKVLDLERQPGIVTPDPEPAPAATTPTPAPALVPIQESTDEQLIKLLTERSEIRSLHSMSFAELAQVEFDLVEHQRQVQLLTEKLSKISQDVGVFKQEERELTVRIESLMRAALEGQTAPLSLVESESRTQSFSDALNSAASVISSARTPLRKVRSSAEEYDKKFISFFSRHRGRTVTRSAFFADTGITGSVTNDQILTRAHRLGFSLKIDTNAKPHLITIFS